MGCKISNQSKVDSRTQGGILSTARIDGGTVHQVMVRRITSQWSRESYRTVSGQLTCACWGVLIGSWKQRLRASRLAFGQDFPKN